MKYSIQPRLPEADSKYELGGVEFDVFRVKEMYDSRWKNKSLHKTLSFARTSYQRYGSRDIFDKHDSKAAIYLIHAKYPQSINSGTNQIIHEWLSVRMVPGDGEFNGVGEPELYSYNNIPITELMRKKIGCEINDFWKFIYSDSRMCGIHPYILGKKNEIIPLHSEKHKYTPICMALMQLKFMGDYPEDRIPYKYVTAIIKPEIRDKVISLKKGDKIIKPNFDSAKKTLALKKGDRIQVNRRIYSYNFPRYWLDLKAFKLLLKDLQNKNIISKKTITHYLGNHSIDSLEGELKFANMLTEKGMLKFATISAEEFRQLVDKYVPDVPELQIIPIHTWRKGFLKILNAAGIKY
jgi:hypothetical protein